MFLDTHFAVWILIIVFMGYVVIMLMMFEETVISVAQSSVETMSVCCRFITQHPLLFQCALTLLAASGEL